MRSSLFEGRCGAQRLGDVIHGVASGDVDSACLLRDGLESAHIDARAESDRDDRNVFGFERAERGIRATAVVLPVSHQNDELATVVGSGAELLRCDSQAVVDCRRTVGSLVVDALLQTQ